MKASKPLACVSLPPQVHLDQQTAALAYLIGYTRGTVGKYSNKLKLGMHAYDRRNPSSSVVFYLMVRHHRNTAPRCSAAPRTAVLQLPACATCQAPAFTTSACVPTCGYLGCPLLGHLSPAPARPCDVVRTAPLIPRLSH